VPITGLIFRLPCGKVKSLTTSKETALKKLRKIAISLALAAVLCGPLAACNTMEGLGKDAQAAGHAVTGAAEKSKGY
jgi:entericidin B